MSSTLKSMIPRFLKTWVRQQREVREVRTWRSEGEPVPPPHAIKQQTIGEVRERFGTKIFVETGTFMGAMVEAQLPHFSTVYSIELSKELHERARGRFRKDKQVRLLQGDSGKVLPQVLEELNGPAIFWLDGHYSGGITALGDEVSPIMAELLAIFAHDEYEHLILIDDARLFTGEDGYPTLDAVRELVRKNRPGYQVDIRHDCIRVTPLPG